MSLCDSKQKCEELQEFCLPKQYLIHNLLQAVLYSCISEKLEFSSTILPQRYGNIENNWNQVDMQPQYEYTRDKQELFLNLKTTNEEIKQQ